MQQNKRVKHGIHSHQRISISAQVEPNGRYMSENLHLFHSLFLYFSVLSVFEIKIIQSISGHITNAGEMCLNGRELVDDNSTNSPPSLAVKISYALHNSLMCAFPIKLGAVYYQ